MRFNILRLLVALVSITVTASLIGCAVTRIDVDVYKGPMANHQDVQTEQLAALAMGAKPLLIELRDRLEGINVTREGVAILTNPDYAGSRTLDYKRDFITPPDPSLSIRNNNNGYSKKKLWLQESQSIRVNAILSLYGDRISSVFPALAASLNDALRRFDDAWDIYTDKSSQDDLVWNTFKFSPTADKKLQADYELLLIARSGGRNQVEVCAYHKLPVGFGSANADFGALGTESFVHDDADNLLDPGDPVGKEQFVKRVRKVSKSFLDARHAVQDLFMIMLDCVERASGPEFASGSKRTELIDGCSTFITSVLERTYLYIELCDAEVGSGAATLRTLLESNLGAAFFDPKIVTDPTKSSEFASKKSQMNDALKRVMMLKPADVAFALRNIQLTFATLDHWTSKTTGYNFEAGEARFGLARITQISGTPGTARALTPVISVPLPYVPAVTTHLALVIRADDVRAWAGSTSFQSGAGLEEGRLDDGIETAIDTYLKATKDYDQQPSLATARDHLAAARRSLVRQLVQFSEKLTFIADNQFMLEKEEPNFDTSGGNHRRFAAILQTVGNSILVAANELYERDDYQVNRDGPAARNRIAGVFDQISAQLNSDLLVDRMETLAADPSSLLDPPDPAAFAAATKKLADDTAQVEKDKTAEQITAKAIASPQAVLAILNTANTTWKGKDLSADPRVTAVLAPLHKAGSPDISTTKFLGNVTDGLAKTYDAASSPSDLRDAISIISSIDATKLFDISHPDPTKDIPAEDAYNIVVNSLKTAPDDTPKAATEAYTKATDADTKAKNAIMTDQKQVTTDSANLDKVISANPAAALTAATVSLTAAKAKLDKDQKAEQTMAKALPPAQARLDLLTAANASWTGKDLSADSRVKAVVDPLHKAGLPDISPAKFLGNVQTGLAKTYDAGTSAPDLRDAITIISSMDPTKLIDISHPDPTKAIAVADAYNIVDNYLKTAPADTLKAATDANTKAIAADTAAKKTVTDDETAVTTATTASTNATKKMNDALQDLTAALNLISAKIAEVSRAKQSPSLTALRQDVLTLLKAMTGNTVAANAVKLLSDPTKITNPQPLKIAANAEDKTPRDVIDELLTMLRMQRVAAVSANGENSKRAQSLDAAIHVAELYRSDMVYIRPPAAYLRTSNVATMFQQGGRDVAWHNLLQRQELRSTPILGEAFDSIAEKSPDYEAIQLIDHQFWQNINTVRVAGTGITNYVITKDDIGNWYVKQYSADPTPIIDAAKSVALYNAGNAINGAAAASRLLQLQDDPNAPAPSQNDLHVATFLADYQKATTSFALKLIGDAANNKPSAQAQIDTALSAAWTKDSTLSDATLQTQLQSVQKTAETSATIASDAGITQGDDATKDTKLPGNILTALQGLKSYQDRILSAIDNLHLENSATIQADQKDLTTKQTTAAASLAKAQQSGVDADNKQALTDQKAVDDAQSKLTTDTAAAQKSITAAKGDVITSFSGVLNPLVQARLDTATTYSTALNVLQRADAATAAPAAAKTLAKPATPAE